MMRRVFCLDRISIQSSKPSLFSTQLRGFHLQKNVFQPEKVLRITHGGNTPLIFSRNFLSLAKSILSGSMLPGGGKKYQHGYPKTPTHSHPRPPWHEKEPKYTEEVLSYVDENDMFVRMKGYAEKNTLVEKFLASIPKNLPRTPNTFARTVYEFVENFEHSLGSNNPEVADFKNFLITDFDQARTDMQVALREHFGNVEAALRDPLVSKYLKKKRILRGMGLVFAERNRELYRDERKKKEAEERQKKSEGWHEAYMKKWHAKMQQYKDEEMEAKRRYG